MAEVVHGLREQIQGLELLHELSEDIHPDRDYASMTFAAAFDWFPGDPKKKLKSTCTSQKVVKRFVLDGGEVGEPLHSRGHWSYVGHLLRLPLELH